MTSNLTEQERNWYVLKGYTIIELLNWRIWKLNNRTHREDGPAMESVSGSYKNYWYLNGIEMSEEEHRIALNEKMKNATA